MRVARVDVSFTTIFDSSGLATWVSGISPFSQAVVHRHFGLGGVFLLTRTLALPHLGTRPRWRARAVACNVTHHMTIVAFTVFSHSATVLAVWLIVHTLSLHLPISLPLGHVERRQTDSTQFNVLVDCFPCLSQHQLMYLMASERVIANTSFVTFAVTYIADLRHVILMGKQTLQVHHVCRLQLLFGHQTRNLVFQRFRYLIEP